MLHINSKERAKTAPAGGETFLDASPPGAQPSHMQRLWHTLQRYPIPIGAILLLLVSLILWLAGRGNSANWTLLAVVLLGGIPLLWETLRQFARKEFSVDVIAILAIAGSLWLGEYLAGAFVVLMLSGGEALEAYALRRAFLAHGPGGTRAARHSYLARR